MKRYLVAVLIVLGLASSVQGAVIATLQETEDDKVEFSVRITNPSDFDYSGFDVTHLDYIFFDDLGDFVNGPLLGNNNNPEIFQPTSHGQIGTSSDGFTIGIQAIVLDNDDQNSNDEDDFALRFIGQTTGLVRGTTPLNFEAMQDYQPTLVRNLSFSVLNAGVFSSNNQRAQALGGFQLEVIAMAPVPLPGASLMLVAGLWALAGLRRRRGAVI